MANLITNAFIQQWSSEVKQAYQQKTSKLRQTVTLETSMGTTHNFTKLASFTANTKSRNGDLTYLEPQHTNVPVTLADYYAPVPIDKLDMNKVVTNDAMRQKYVEGASAAINRSLDAAIVAAWEASNTPITTTAGGFTFAKFLEGIETLNSVDADGERFLIVGPKQITEALQIVNLTSVDYAALSEVRSGAIRSALGVTWIMSNRLTGTGSPAIRNCYLVDKAATGLAINQDVMTEINYVAHQALWLVTSMLTAGAAVIDAEGVVQIPCSE